MLAAPPFGGAHVIGRYEGKAKPPVEVVVVTKKISEREAGGSASLL